MMIFGWTDDVFRQRERELRDSTERLRSGRRMLRRRHGISPGRRRRRVSSLPDPG
jgi:plasmid stabilization system protein ParE